MAKYQIRRDKSGWYTPYRRLFGIWWNLSFWCQDDYFIAYFKTEEECIEWLTSKSEPDEIVREVTV